MKKSISIILCIFYSILTFAQEYSIVIKDGHVIDPKNNIDDVMDVAISNGGGRFVRNQKTSIQKGSSGSECKRFICYRNRHSLA